MQHCTESFLSYMKYRKAEKKKAQALLKSFPSHTQQHTDRFGALWQYLTL